jgi:hypothetical protein
MMIAKSFTQSNKLWKSFKIKIEDVVAIIRLKILPAIHDVSMVIHLFSFLQILLDKHDNVIGASI